MSNLLELQIIYIKLKTKDLKLRLDKSYKLLKKIENIGIILKPNSPELKDVYLKIKCLFENKNINIFLEEQSAKMIDDSGFCFEELCLKVDFLVSVGGDGTLLGVVRKAFKYELPVLGINLGTLGFLTDLNMNQLPEFIEDLLKNNYKINQRMIIKGSIKSKKFIINARS